jgi:hypothetical protein
MNISSGPQAPVIRNGERWGKRNTAGVAFATSLS